MSLALRQMMTLRAESGEELLTKTTIEFHLLALPEMLRKLMEQEGVELAANLLHLDSRLLDLAYIFHQ